MNYQRIEQVYAAARKKYVSFSMHYMEVDDSWSFSVHSIAPSEEWSGKSRSFDIAVDACLEWIESL